ncbi:MAG: DUF72 domain-containing protein [Pirellulales bacterium]|nr:DUF72 domain-containing protein [Pirellulales bacterium]
MPHATPALPIHLGCPIWACGDWANQVYPPRTPRHEWLKWYTRTFNSVEGNNTFYALPKLETVQRWAEQAAGGFRFCLKFPSKISHELELVGAEQETAAFLQLLEPLAKADRLGPTFLQLGPHFGPDRLRVLSRFLHLLPREMPWAVELRHHGWYDSGPHEHRVNDLLIRHHIDKVLFDSRPLFQSPPEDEWEEKSQSRKPQTPVRQTITGKRPMLRIVGRNRVEMADKFLHQWVPIVARWVADGLRPYVFTHTPAAAQAPRFARRFAALLQPELPDHDLSIPFPPQPDRQLSLLD